MMRSRLVLLTAQTITLGLMIAFLVVPASALFLSRYGAGGLPYAYLAVAASGVVVSAAIRRAQARSSVVVVALSVLTAYLVLVAGGWLILTTQRRLVGDIPAAGVVPVVDPAGLPDRRRAGGTPARRSRNEGAPAPGGRRVLGRLRHRQPGVGVAGAGAG